MDTTQLLKGVLDLAVLAVVADEDGYGYDVVSRLRAGGLEEVGDASVYGTLRRLYAAGSLTSYVVPPTRVRTASTTASPAPAGPSSSSSGRTGTGSRRPSVRCSPPITRMGDPMNEHRQARHPARGHARSSRPVRARLTDLTEEEREELTRRSGGRPVRARWPRGSPTWGTPRPTPTSCAPPPGSTSRRRAGGGSTRQADRRGHHGAARRVHEQRLDAASRRPAGRGREFLVIPRPLWWFFRAWLAARSRCHQRLATCRRSCRPCSGSGRA